MAISKRQLEALLAFASGELAPDDAASVEARLSTDPDATAVVQRFRTLLEIGRSDDSVAPPAHLVAQAKALFQSPAADPAPGLADVVREIVARLTFDSRVGLAGVRDGASDATQCGYESELADLDLRIEAGRDGLHITGQVTSEAVLEGLDVHRHGSVHPLCVVPLDERGFFELDLPSGTFDILVRTDQGVVRVPSVEIP
jgi:hypothetical protein